MPPRHSSELSEAPLGVIEVLEYLTADDQIERSFTPRKVVDRRLAKLDQRI
jgi:hypothetical protein